MPLPESTGSAVTLRWTPAEEEELSAPFGDENIRGLVVQPQLKHAPNTKSCRKAFLKTDDGATEMQKMLNMQSARLISFMETLMLRQEQTLTCLLKEQSQGKFSYGDHLVHASSSSSRSRDCMNEVKRNTASSGVEAEGGVLKASQCVEADGYHETDLTGQASMVSYDVQSSYGVVAHKRSSIPNAEDDIVKHVSWKRTYSKPGESNSKRVSVWKRVWHSTETKTNLGGLVSNHRQILRRVLNSRLYDLAMALLIVFNSLLIVIETDASANCYGEQGNCAPSWLLPTNLVLLVIYTLESLAVIYVYRSRIYRKGSRLFEIFIVVSGWIDIIFLKIFGETLPSMQTLKLIRLTRLLRGMRLFNLFPELQTIMNGFLSSMRAMLWGFVLLMLILVAMSIVAVELVHDVNKTLQHESKYCTEAFQSVWHATLLFFQTTAAGDSWGACTMALMKLQPLSFLLFGSAVVGVQVGFLNLIMSVIIERVSDARHADTARKLREKDKQIESSQKRWHNIFETLDADGSGELSIDELVKGFDTIPYFRDDLRLLGIERTDLPTLFALMDEDNNAKVSVDELLSMLDMVWHFDDKMHQVTTSMQSRAIARRLERRLKKLEDQVRNLLWHFQLYTASPHDSIHDKPTLTHDVPNGHEASESIY